MDTMIVIEKIHVSGMSCNHCVNGVTTALEALDGVHCAQVSLENKMAEVTFEDEKIDVKALKLAITAKGFGVDPLPPNNKTEFKIISATLPKEGIQVIPPPKKAPTEMAFKIEGMSCANCSGTIEKALKASKGIEKAAVNFSMEKGFVAYDETLIDTPGVLAIVNSAGYRAVNEETEETNHGQLASTEKFRFFFAVSLTIPLTILMYTMPFGHTTTNYLMCILATLVQFVSGRTFYEGAYHSLKNRSTNMDVLISLGISAAYFYSLFSLFFIDPAAHTFFDSSAMLITFIMVGKILEASAKGKTGLALEKLMSLQADKARIVENGSERMVKASMVKVGDIVSVRPGETIPVDGEIVEGTTTIDESMITGESIPLDKDKNDPVTGATINQTGVIRIKALRVGKATMLSNIVKMVADAQADKAPIQRVADVVSNYFVPVVVCVALVTFFLWYAVIDYAVPSGSSRFLFSFQLMIAVLVVACPCALGLATPTAIMVGSGVGLKRGILFKRASVLETISHLDIVLFDKTGTITQGRPQVSSIHPMENRSKTEVLKIAASVEANSIHPLAEAVVRKALDGGIVLEKNINTIEIPGQGTRGELDGKKIMVGNLKLQDKKTGLSKQATTVGQALSDAGQSTVYVWCDNEIIGIIALSDEIKSDSREAITRLHKLGIKTALISGDNPKAARAVAETVGIHDVEAEVLPGDKAQIVKKWQQRGLKVGMAGDGINDAPALAQADIGIAVGSGTDIAKETGDVILVNSTLLDVERAIRLGRKTLGTIKMNFFWAFFYNILMIPIAAGLLYPVLGLVLKPEWACIAMWFSSLTVVGNSLLLKNEQS
jgi:Cu+-exporting ATPase